MPVLTPLAQVVTMVTWLAEEVAAVLVAHGIPDSLVRAAREQMQDGRLAATANRSVVGVMNEFTFLADAYRTEARRSARDGGTAGAYPVQPAAPKPQQPGPRVGCPGGFRRIVTSAPR